MSGGLSCAEHGRLPLQKRKNKSFKDGVLRLCAKKTVLYDEVSRLHPSSILLGASQATQAHCKHIHRYHRPAMGFAQSFLFQFLAAGSGRHQVQFGCRRERYLLKVHPVRLIASAKTQRWPLVSLSSRPFLRLWPPLQQHSMKVAQCSQHISGEKENRGLTLTLHGKD